MKLNNKGMTITEVVITFTMLMIVMLAMMGLITNLKKTQNEKEKIIEIKDYKDIVIREIEDALIKLKFNGVHDCSNKYEDYILCKVLVFKDSSNKELLIDTGMKFIKYDGIKYKIPSYVKMNRDKTYIEINNKFLTISVPFYYNNKETGIKIVYPIGL